MNCNIMKSLKNMLLERMSRSDAKDLEDLVMNFKNVDSDKFWEVAYPNEEIDKDLERIINKYDKYAEDVLQELFNPNSSLDEKVDRLEDMINDNEMRNGTESWAAIEMINNFYNWAVKKHIVK